MDLALPLTDWQDIVGARLGLGISLAAQIRELQDSFRLQRNRFLEEFDENNLLDRWDLNGVNIGVSTDTEGLIYVRVFDETPGAGQFRVRGYLSAAARAADAGAHIFTGEGVDSATITLTAANSSGVSGTVRNPVGSAPANNSSIRLRALLDWPTHILNTTNGTEEDDALVRNAYNVMVAELSRLATSMETAVKNGLAMVLRSYIANRMQTKGDSEGTVRAENDSGLITLFYQGVLPVLRDRLEDNTPGPQSVQRYQVSAGAAQFDSDNTGQGALAISLMPSARPGRYRFTLDDDTIGTEEFTVELALSGRGGAFVAAANKLRVNRTFRDTAVGIASALLTRSLLKTGDAGNNVLGTAAQASVTGETENNTEVGVLGWRTVANGVNFDLEVHEVTATASMTSATMVAYFPTIVINTNFTMQERNNSGLVVNWRGGAGALSATSGTLNLRVFRITQTGDGELDPDTFEVVATLGTDRGEAEAILQTLFSQGLNAVAAGGETIAEAYFRRNGVAGILEGRRL